MPRKGLRRKPASSAGAAAEGAEAGAGSAAAAAHPENLLAQKPEAAPDPDAFGGMDGKAAARRRRPKAVATRKAAAAATAQRGRGKASATRNAATAALGGQKCDATAMTQEPYFGGVDILALVAD